jgi:hypothetical protein
MMRTTLEIDDDLIAIFRERANRGKTSIGRMISNELRSSLNGGSKRSNGTDSDFIRKNGLVFLAPRGEVITYEHVQNLLEEEDL